MGQFAQASCGRLPDSRTEEGGARGAPDGDHRPGWQRGGNCRMITASRFHQIILIVSTLLGSWLGMQAVHELGHVIGAWLTGGQVSQVVLHPLTISRTHL